MLKRAHLQSLAFERRAVKKVRGMTPARFDLLYLLRRVALDEGASCHPLSGARRQTGLWKDLGLHRSTVSKMLKRLEEMGWIVRTRDPMDRRTFTVRLTEKGLLRIWLAMRRVFRGKIMRGAYERLYRPEPAQPWHEFEVLSNPVVAAERAAKWKRFSAIGATNVVDVIYDVYRTVQEIARYFGDRSAVWYDLGCRLPPRPRPADWAL